MYVPFPVVFDCVVAVCYARRYILIRHRHILRSAFTYCDVAQGPWRTFHDVICPIVDTDFEEHSFYELRRTTFSQTVLCRTYASRFLIFSSEAPIRYR
jgi:hypothetical protein